MVPGSELRSALELAPGRHLALALRRACQSGLALIRVCLRGQFQHPRPSSPLRTHTHQNTVLVPGNCHSPVPPLRDGDML